MTYPMQIPPELFSLVGVGIFLALSLLTYFGENRFPRKLPYIYQIAALLGLLLLVTSKFVFPQLDESIRLWYCYGYLIAALANIVGTNIYLAVPKRQHNVSRMWSLVVTFPSILASTYFVVQYGLSQTTLMSSTFTWLTISQITVAALGAATAICVGIAVIHRISRAELHPSVDREVTK